jgi:hypothetical protein
LAAVDGGFSYNLPEVGATYLPKTPENHHSWAELAPKVAEAGRRRGNLITMRWNRTARPERPKLE